jgi:hypothetical protein
MSYVVLVRAQHHEPVHDVDQDVDQNAHEQAHAVVWAEQTLDRLPMSRSGVVAVVVDRQGIISMIRPIESDADPAALLEQMLTADR